MLAKKYGLSNSAVAITLLLLIASGKTLNGAREGNADSLVFLKKRKNARKGFDEKKSNAPKRNAIFTDHFAVQETNVTVTIGELFRNLTLTKERDFSKDVLIENFNLKVVIKEK